MGMLRTTLAALPERQYILAINVWYNSLGVH